MSNRIRCLFALVLSCLFGLLLASCDSLHELPEIPPEFPTEDSASITDHHGGTHHRTKVRGRLWYQTFGTELLVLDAQDGSVINRVQPLPLGTSGALVDFAFDDHLMYVVADGDAVIELDLTDQRQPTVRQVRPAKELGIRPRAISVLDGEIWISGDGGVVNWNTSEPPRLSGERISEQVVMTEVGPAVPVGRRVHAISDGAFLGAASMLAPLPEESGVAGGLLFVLQGVEGASVGVMGSDIRQIDDFVVRGVVRSVRYANGHLWAISDQEMAVAEVRRDGRLGTVEWIKVKGARDLDGAGPNYLVVGGTFGRAIHRFKDDSTGDGDEFLAVVREPGSLMAAVDDGRRVLTGSPQGSWIYTIGDSIEIVDRPITMDTPPSDFAAGKWGDARIDNDKKTVVIHIDDNDQEWHAPNHATIRTLAIVGPRLWIGHDEGLSLVKINGGRENGEYAYFNLPPPPRVEFAEDIRITSGVSHILPSRVGDRVVYVSPNGGVGIAAAAPVMKSGWQKNSS
ncbi:MAG: hypothetical protein P8J45_12175 [Phycisphaerales bacterium]|jgi:hypothetical protein|nr:hypothetical protein [Phycisphaerales bacterium]